MGSDTWPLAPIGEHVTVSQGLAINKGTKHLLEDSGLPLLRITDLITNTASQFVNAAKVPQKCIAEPSELIYTRTGQVGLVFKNRKGVVHNNCFKVIPKRTLDRDFLYWFLFQKTTRDYVNSIASGSVQKDLNHASFFTLEIPLPPLSEQKAIAAVLGALDDKIELNRRMNTTLEAMARALFQSWFVDFDPVRAKQDGRPPTGLGEATATLFPDQFQDSELGAIPQGWKVGLLSDLASITMGLSPDGDSYNAAGIGTPLINGPVEFGEYFPVKSKWTSAPARLAGEGDLIFCVRGSTTGRRIVSDGEYAIGRGVCAMRAKNGLRSFLYQTINAGLERLLEKNTGSVFPSLSAPDIKAFTVLHPPESLLRAYECKTKPLIERIENNHRESCTLATLRDTLLPKLLSGEVNLSGVRFLYE